MARELPPEARAPVAVMESMLERALGKLEEQFPRRGFELKARDFTNLPSGAWAVKRSIKAGRNTLFRLSFDSRGRYSLMVSEDYGLVECVRSVIRMMVDALDTLARLSGTLKEARHG